MKITTYNSDGSIKEVQTHHFQIPYYIQTFEPGLFFMDVSREDVSIVSYKGYDIEKDFLINQYRFFIRFDFNNYKKYCLGNDSSFSILDCVIENRCESQHVLDLDYLLSSLLRLFRRPISSIDGDWLPKVEEFFFSDFWIETIVRHAKKATKRKSGYVLLNSIISIVRRLYYFLNKLDKLGLLFDKYYDILYGLYPFAAIQSSIYSMVDVWDDDKVLARVVESLYYRGAGSRKFTYALADMFESIIHYEASNNQSIQLGVVSMMTTGSSPSAKKHVTIKAKPSNKVEIKEIELSQEEIVSIRCPYETIGKDVLNKLGDELKKEYAMFKEKNSKDVEERVEIEAIRRKRVSNARMLTQKQWKDFYFECLDKLEDEYKAQYENLKKLEVPYYYYYLLVETCSSSQRYDFNDNFLESLVYMAIENKLVERYQLYFQMCRLNYIEEEANIIKKDNSQTPEDPLDKEMEELRCNLLNGENEEIAKEFLTNNFPKGLDREALIQRIRVFIAPLFSKDYIIDMEVSEFEKYFYKIFYNDIIITKLKNKDCYLPFNLKLVLNILGYLSKDNKEYIKTVKPPLKARLGNGLCERIEHLWMRSIPSNYRKCVSQYDHILEKKNTTFTIFDPEIKRAVDDEWKLYKLKKDYTEKAQHEARVIFYKT